MTDASWWPAGLPLTWQGQAAQLMRADHRAQLTLADGRNTPLPDNTLLVAAHGTGGLLAVGPGAHAHQAISIDISGRPRSVLDIPPTLPIAPDQDGKGWTGACRHHRNMVRLDDQQCLSSRMQSPALLGFGTHIVTGGASGQQFVLTAGPSSPRAVVLHFHGGPHLPTTASQVTAWQARLPDMIGLWCCDLVGSTGWGDDWAEALNADWMNRRWRFDIEALIMAARHRHPSVPVLLCGESWGGYVVLRAASAGMGDGWAALMPVADWFDQLLHPRAAWDLALQALELHDPSDPRVGAWNIKVFSSANPGLLVWATHDEVVSSTATLRLAERLRPYQHQLECLELTASSHREFSMTDMLRLRDALFSWVDRCLSTSHSAGD